MEQVQIVRPSQEEQQLKDPVFLLSAARYGHLNKIRDLIEKQHMAVDALGEDGFTALHLAVSHGRAAVVEYLVKEGADVFAKNTAGETPYDMAKNLETKNPGNEVYRALHDYGLLVRHHHPTPLHSPHRSNLAIILQINSIYFEFLFNSIR